MKRELLIEQLRHALHLAESPVETVIEFDLANTNFCIELEDPEPVSDIERLNNRLTELTGNHIRIVAFQQDSNGVKSIYDIKEFHRKEFCTKKTNKISKAGVDFLGVFGGATLDLIEFEQAGPQL